jgi:hypothetical protein
VDTETRAYLDAALDGLRQEIRAGTAETAALRHELRVEMAELQREMRETAVETRRHFDVVGESIRSDVRAVAEGVAANTEAIERLGTGLRAEMDSRFTASHAVVRVALQELRRDILERGPRSPL